MEKTNNTRYNMLMKERLQAKKDYLPMYIEELNNSNVKAYKEKLITIFDKFKGEKIFKDERLKSD